MNDLISRSYALKQIEKAKAEHIEFNYDTLIDFVKVLPSVNPQESILNKIKTEIENLTYYWCEVNPKTVIDEVLDIIDEYKTKSEDNG